ncbi:hypothetical protein [Pseudodesulfovibrio senegalensis]|jgi:hypothetical protein|uniref:hypothetical protein n=1 Tax=Pseudodesulfovibrio senegalensis TaxID=1721087 RepID=UPI0014783559|nr:hypothetical protein [Pseudodesulfovibrio senegalensis]
MFRPLEAKTAKHIHYEKGVTYISRRMERTIFFVLTIGMMLWGIYEKFVAPATPGG